MLMKSHTARVIESVGCGVIIGAILGLLTGVFITGNTDDSAMRGFILGGVVLGGIITFSGGFIRDIRKVKKTLAERN